MGFMKAFASLVIVCFSFALNSLGQKVEIKQDSEIIVNGKLYAIIEVCPQPETGYAYSSIINNYIKKFPSYKLLSPERLLLAYILPQPHKKRHSEKNSPHPYYVLFSPTSAYRETLNYPPFPSIKQVFIEDLVKFDLVSNNKLNRPALKKLFEHYNKDILKSLDNLYRPSHYYPAKEIDCKEEIIKLEDSFIYKYQVVSIESDTIVKEVDFFDELKKPYGRATFISLHFQNGERLFKYRFTSSETKESFLVIPEFNGYIQLKSHNCYSIDKPKMQLITLLDYLKSNYYL